VKKASTASYYEYAIEAVLEIAVDDDPAMFVNYTESRLRWNIFRIVANGEWRVHTGSRRTARHDQVEPLLAAEQVLVRIVHHYREKPEFVVLGGLAGSLRKAFHRVQSASTDFSSSFQRSSGELPCRSPTWMLVSSGLNSAGSEARMRALLIGFIFGVRRC